MSDGEGPRRGRTIGIDLGTRRIGVAVSDSAGILALPRTTVVRTGDAERDRRAMVALVLEEGATTVVVGLPLSLDGSKGRAAVEAIDEADALRALLGGYGVSVELYDERLTTVSAHRALATRGDRERARRPVVDQAAAAVMLSAWLQEHGRR